MSSSNRVKLLLSVLLIVILAASAFSVYLSYSRGNSPKAESTPYVGVAFAGNTSAEAKAQIEKIKSYTNLFVLDMGRSELSRNQTAVMEIADYAVANGLSVVLNLGISNPHSNDSVQWFWNQSLTQVKQDWTARWGDKFLGIYNNDEPGGIQLDGDWKGWYTQYGRYLSRMNNSATDALNEIYQKMLDAHNGTLPTDYNLEADFFINKVLKEGDPGIARLNNASITTFTSDYGLYWFDYLGGYDVLLAQLGWNSSVAQQIALVKGAARMQEKDWGVIVTWKYQGHPFLDTGAAVYSQMLTAYQAGAKYIAIFDYSKDTNGNSDVAMTEEHYIALHHFWRDIHTKTFQDLSEPEAAMVLPANYGWGMRNHDDTIWGFWGTDAKTPQISATMGKLLAQYGVALDIVYEDPAFPVERVQYQQIYYWNTTIV